MSQDDEKALEAVAAALVSNKCHCEQCVDIRREQARKVITAYLSAMPQRVSPYLIAKLNALASRLTQMGEYEACDLIDTVVERVSAMPGRELLAEALEALDELISMYSGVCSNLPFGVTSNAETERDLRRARAAADKIRAAMGGE